MNNTLFNHYAAEDMLIDMGRWNDVKYLGLSIVEVVTLDIETAHDLGVELWFNTVY